MQSEAAKIFKYCKNTVHLNILSVLLSFFIYDIILLRNPGGKLLITEYFKEK